MATDVPRAEDSHPIRSSGLPGAGRWQPFAAVAALTLLACLVAGQLVAPGDPPLSLPAGLTLPAGWFILLFMAIVGLSLLAVLFFPRGLSFRPAALTIAALGLAARLLLLPHPPSDDVNRYLWEGRVLASGFSPYRHAPRAEDDQAVDHLRDPDDAIYRGINHPEYTAIYPPLMMSVFAGVASVAYHPLAIKVLMLLADLITLLLVLLLLRDRRSDPRWALLYALSPVALVAFAGEGHNDALQVLALTAALLLSRQKRWRWMWLLLGLAVQAKVLALLAWPFFLNRESWRHLWTGVIAAGAPLLLVLAIDQGALFSSFLAFGFDMAFNGPLQSALRAAIGSTRLATICCQLAFLPVYWTSVVLLHPGRPKGPADATAGLLFAFGAFLLFSPTVHLWYLSLLLPLLALRPTASWLVLTATIAFTFVPYGQEALTGSWAFPWWGPLAVWTVPLLLLPRELRLGLLRLRARRRQASPAPATVTVVIPTFREEERIEGCLGAVMTQAAVTQVIVVDAGSDDSTRALAEAAGALVLEHRAPFERGGGRGGQIAAGLGRATGEVIVIVHADTRLQPGAIDAILETLAAHPEVAGGALGAIFDGPGLTLRLIEAANDLRAAFLGISFGDQVQFFRRTELDRFPALPLMEDVELSLRLVEAGRSAFLWGSSLVSPRRWQRDSSAGRVLLVVRLTGEYLLRRLVGAPDTVAMYRRYYG